MPQIWLGEGHAANSVYWLMMSTGPPKASECAEDALKPEEPDNLVYHRSMARLDRAAFVASSAKSRQAKQPSQFAMRQLH
ncbi:hypothetical protein Q644_06435 [Brucella intermedia 229E]|uniref:Uncharacterized protein n=1 Tax=Brucella intermedia 229E TaxID=1337887 RepID=U4V528_9HYPH|nr:hypothetical protein Q644_06435 [Brucella intermedia 229E]